MLFNIEYKTILHVKKTSSKFSMVEYANLQGFFLVKAYAQR